MWVHTIRLGLMEIVLNTNKGVERQNKDLNMNTWDNLKIAV